MRICLFDPYTPKFTGDMVEWWTDHGHEVKVDRYYDPDKVDWADVVWFDTCDNNLLSATNPSQAIRDEWLVNRRKEIPWDLHEYDLSKKKIIVRPIDIEVWQGHFAYDNMWNVVDDVIFLAPHIQQIMMADSRPQQGTFKQHVIPCGVNLDRYTFKERKPGYNIGVVGELWMSKGVDYALQIAFKLKAINSKYHIHWLGKNQMYHWEYEYCLDFIKRNKLNFTINHEWVDSVDAWLEDKDYLLSCSKKEAFGYNIAEGMAKGIRPIVHHFYGAEHLWPGMTWDSIDEAIDMLTDGVYDSNSYRQYLIDHNLILPQMMEKFDEIMQP